MEFCRYLDSSCSSTVHALSVCETTHKFPHYGIAKLNNVFSSYMQVQI